MAPLDSGPWLAVVSDELPAGPNLEFDADFGALERAAQGKPEQQYGDTIIPAEEPDWKEVGSLALGLLDRTRDLRVLAHLAVAKLHLAGLSEYAEVLQLIRQLLESRWADIHPQLDADDDNDPTLRANALLRLSHPGLVLRHLRDLPLASSPRVGQYSWRDVAIATGALESNAKGKPTEAVVRSAFQDSDPERLVAIRTAAAHASDAAAAIPAIFDARSGAGTGPDFDELVKLLKDLVRTIERYASMPAAAPDQIVPEDAGSSEDPAAPPGQTASAPRLGPLTVSQLTEVTNRADALRLLDLVTQYYQRFEPSSPLPLLIERARRLAEKNFLEVLRDLAPNGVDQAQIVVGAPQ
jgi:type VI secretion system protein ImpA